MDIALDVLLGPILYRRFMQAAVPLELPEYIVDSFWRLNAGALSSERTNGDRSKGGPNSGDRMAPRNIKFLDPENRMRTPHTIARFVLLTGALLAASGCSKNGSAQAPFQMPPPPVTVARAVAHDVPSIWTRSAAAGAFESVTVTPQVPGRILERHFQDGEQLKKDQLLFTIDPRPYQAQLDAAQAQLAQSQAALDLAKTQLKMYASITDIRAVSELDHETKKNTVAVDAAQVQAAQAAVENAQLNLEYCYIHSPIEGRAGARLVDVGNVVQANTSGLLLIQHLDPIYADFTVTERDLPEVQAQMAKGTLRTMVRLPSDAPAAARAGTLTFLDNAVQASTGTVNLRATVPNPDRHFWPGQFVNVSLILATAKGAVLVPNQATQISQQGPFVYVVKPDDTTELRPVSLGQRQGDDVVVTKGVAGGRTCGGHGTDDGDSRRQGAGEPAPQRGQRQRRSRRARRESLRALHPSSRDDGRPDRLGDPVWRAGLPEPAGQRPAGGRLSRSSRFRWVIPAPRPRRWPTTSPRRSSVNSCRFRDSSW